MPNIRDFEANLCTNPQCPKPHVKFWVYDARGIPCAPACVNCEDQVRRKYRTDVMENPNYQADEPIEPEDY